MEYFTPRYLLLQGFLIVLIAASNASAQCDFSYSCKDVTVTGNFLAADCLNSDGAYDRSSLNMNDMIGNSNGRLVFPGTSFRNSCLSVEINDGHTLTASCKGTDGQYHPTSLDLNSCVYNADGMLDFCGYGVGKSTAYVKSSTV
ncbi:hypothetical protein KP509_32G000600 [Ceratopteris richardii]|nr:hypothetical protein KP509_32G000600 [Ceratopteris richardii]KAH7286316.1 hypothetical protein KP509_32G000600 [Ceratopteris richardii]